MLKIFKKFADLFKLKCPHCNGDMKSEYYDMRFDRTVYKCENCGKEWI